MWTVELKYEIPQSSPLVGEEAAAGVDGRSN